MDIQELQRRAGIVEDDSITECPDTDASVAAARDKVGKVLQAVLQSVHGEAREWIIQQLQAVIRDLDSAESESRANHAGDQNGIG
ncbi:MAG: hypothetical protein ACTSX2_04005 [Candidatus Thorarchaeota archaeon]